MLQTAEVAHGADATALVPAAPAESGFSFSAWDGAEKLTCVAGDVTCWALYEAETAKSPSTSISSQSVAVREMPYSLDEYFQLYDNLAWSDEFSGTSLSAGYGSGNNWQINTDKDGQEQLQTYTTSGNVTVSDGTLKLTCKRESSTRITSGRIVSRNKVAFLKGRCEIRAKITKVDGAFPAFWTMGSNHNWPWGGEIDIMEQLNGSDWIGGTLHMPVYPNSYDRTIESNSGHAVPEDGVHWGDGFHRIGVIVNERDLIWYVDDHIYQRMDIRDSKYDLLRSESQYVILNYAFGGNWCGVTNMSQSAAMNLTSEDFEIDYCRIFTNTEADKTISRTAEPQGAQLSGPVKATVWRGWQMNWGKSGAGYYQSHMVGSDAKHIGRAVREYVVRDNPDVVTFFTRPQHNTGGTATNSWMDVPGYTAVNLSPNAGRSWTDWDRDSREKLLSIVLFNKKRFSQSDSSIGTLLLSNDYSFTNCTTMVAELIEKDTGAKVKVVGVFVSSTAGANTAGSAAEQGFSTLISKLDDIKDEKVVLLLQGWDADCLSYIDSKINSELSPSYSKLGQYTHGWPDYQYQSVWATANCQASAEQPAPLNLGTSNTYTNQSFCATVLFDELPPEPVVEYGQLDMSAFSKRMTVAFSGVQSGVALTNFPVLVKLSEAIEGFGYGDFAAADGGDLRFADAAGNLLPHEIDTWDTNGVSTAWVKVPALSRNATITACWGCSGTPPAVAPKDVWDDGYVGVWHLGEKLLPMKESSETTSDFTTANGTDIAFASQGIVGGSVDFASGANCSLVAPGMGRH